MKCTHKTHFMRSAVASSSFLRRAWHEPLPALGCYLGRVSPLSGATEIHAVAAGSRVGARAAEARDQHLPEGGDRRRRLRFPIFAIEVKPFSCSPLIA